MVIGLTLSLSYYVSHIQNYVAPPTRQPGKKAPARTQKPWEKMGIFRLHYRYSAAATKCEAPLLLREGKLKALARLNAAATGELLYLTEQQSGRRFLVDSGASFSILPFTSTSPPSGPRLIGPSSSLLCCWVKEKQQLGFGGHSFTWTFHHRH